MQQLGLYFVIADHMYSSP